ncbi:MAG: RlmE family RNA methyltransferase [bacterium]|nr:RlmE family RNA methyltransferase [bacterium]
MPQYKRKDHYYQQAKQKGFKSRAAFKLLDIHKKFRLIKPGMEVVDLGCAPGGWLQVLSKEVGTTGHVVGIDLNRMDEIPEKNIDFIQGSIEDEQTVQLLFTKLGKRVDLVTSDMSPNLSGVKFQDRFHSYQLSLKAFDLCCKVLRRGGHFVVKIFPGEDLEEFKQQMKEKFVKVQQFVPDSTRKTSVEVYLIGKEFK